MKTKAPAPPGGPYGPFGDHHIECAKVLDALAEFDDDTFDALLSDVPYGFGSHEPTPAELLEYLSGQAELNTGGDFMGSSWSVPSVATWRALFRVLKPGAPVAIFAGAKTDDLIAMGMRMAGFYVRDKALFLHAKGMPKNQNVPHAIDSFLGFGRKTTDPIATPVAANWAGHGTALKPAYESIIIARKPLNGTLGCNVFAQHVGPLDISACRIGDAGGTRKDPSVPTDESKNAYGDGLNGGKIQELDEGRWPANVLLDETAAELLDATVGNRPSRKSVTRNGGGNAGGPVFDGRVSGKARPDSGRSETGGPSRFFFTAKTSTSEREYGCDALPQKTAGEATGGRAAGSAGLDNARAGAGRTSGARNHHPCLKPLALTRWLGALLKPPASYTEATLLVPYSGSGSEVVGALMAGWGNVLGIEYDEAYCTIAEARIKAWDALASEEGHKAAA